MKRIFFRLFILSVVFYFFSSYKTYTLFEWDFVPLFNGENLESWVNVNCAPETWTVRDNMIICTGFPTGVLRTSKQYENFILELEWKHLHEKGNAGLFVHSDDITALGKPFTRSVECQIMDGNHGDVFAIHGARMTRDNEDPFDKIGWIRSFPTEHRAKPAGEWNHYRVESLDGKLTLAVNGKIVTRAFHANPRKGYICLESEGSEVHFKNIRLKELSGSSALPEQTAFKDRGFKSLYNGLDFRGWKSAKGKDSWEAKNWILGNNGIEENEQESILWSEGEFRNFKLIADWRLTAEPVAKSVPVIQYNGKQANDEKVLLTVPIRYAGEGGILIRGSNSLGISITSWPEGSGGIFGYREEGVFNSEVRKSSTPIAKNDNPNGTWNRFEITVIDDQVSVILNGEEVIKKATINNLPDHGPVGLRVIDFPIEFANIYVREL